MSSQSSTFSEETLCWFSEVSNAEKRRHSRRQEYLTFVRTYVGPHDPDITGRVHGDTRSNRPFRGHSIQSIPTYFQENFRCIAG